ncbi:hypothetical protein F5I97DRAFT_753051 [Phlebopus sp. FC_14]|nr:hypothetical protein F5I97DRAFT_753051 [Phlebopus sp. FC_14]
MDQFRRIFRISGVDSDAAPLKHAKSMPLRSKSKTHSDQEADYRKPAYRGQHPLQKTDIVYVEQFPGVLDISHSMEDPPRPRYNDTYGDLLDKFPCPPPPPPVPPRSPLRSMSLNKREDTPYIVEGTLKCVSAGRVRTIQRSSSVACFSRPTAVAYPDLTVGSSVQQQRREFPIHGNIPIPELAAHNKLHLLGSDSSRRADRLRAPSHAPWPTYSQAAVNYPIPHAHTHPLMPRSAVHASRSNLQQPSSPSIRSRTPSGTGRGQGPTLGDALDAQERERARRMIAKAPFSPPVVDNLPFNLRPIYFDMQNPRCDKLGLNYHLHLAIGSGRPLDARYDGEYHRLLEPDLPKGIVPEVGQKWSVDFIPVASCPCTLGSRPAPAYS